MGQGLYHIMPGVGVAIFLPVLLLATLRRAALPGGWALAALASLLFAGWTIHTVTSMGPLAFWDEHVRNAWSNQIWLDLLCAGATAFILLAPRARAAGMLVPGWALFVVSTGSVGLLAMLARCLWLEARAPRT